MLTLVVGAWGFTTATAWAAGVSPTSVAPAASAVVAPPSVVSASYSAALNTLAGASSLTVSSGGAVVSGAQSFSDSNRTITFTPSARLADGSYTATATVQELTAPPQSGTSSWSFTVDGTPPRAPTIDPLAVVNRANEAAVTITGAESEADATVRVTVSGPGFSPVTAVAQQGTGGSWSAGVNLSSLPDGPFDVAATATDPVGNASTRTARGTKDTTAPSRVSTSPADGSTVGAPRTVSVRWSELIDPATAVLTVASADGTSDPGTLAVSADAATLTLQSLPTSAGNPWTISGSAVDQAGNRTSGTVTQFNVQPPGTGTDVCGQLPFGSTVWSAQGAPYRVCADGVVVPANAQLQLDGSLGPFAVAAQGSGGIAVYGGALTTVSTDASDRVSFDSAAGSPWAGLSVTRPEGIYDAGNPAGLVRLSYVTIAHAVTGVKAFWSYNGQGLMSSASLDHLIVTASTGDAIVAQYAQLTVTNSNIDTSLGRGIAATCLLPGNANAIHALQVSTTTVALASGVGIDLEYCPDPQLTDNTVLNSGLSAPPKPAIMVSSADPTTPLSAAQTLVLGAATGISGNAGAGNGIDAIALAGEQQGSFTWLTPSDSTSVHPLGYLNLGLHVTGTGTASFPAGSVVKSGALPGSADPVGVLRPGQLFVDGPALVSATGTVFTSLSDDTVGPSTCSSSLSASCTPDNTAWPGIRAMSGASLTGTTIEHSEIALRSQDFGTVSPTGAKVSGSTLTIRDCQMAYFGDDLSLTDSTVSGIHLSTKSPAPGARVFVEWPGSAIWVEGSLTLQAVQISDVQQLGVHAEPTSSSKALDLENVTEDHVGSGLDVIPNYNRTVRYDDPVITGLTITHSTSTARIHATDVQLGPGRHVDRLTGADNTHDAVLFEASFVGGFSWVTPAESSDLHPLGYGDYTYTLLGGTLTVPAGANVTAHLIDLVGATLTAAPSAHLSVNSLVARDASAGTTPAILLDGITWNDLNYFRYDSDAVASQGIEATADATVRITNSTLTGLTQPAGTQGVAGAVFQGPITLDHDTFTNLGFGVHGGGTLTNSTVGSASAPALLGVFGPAQLTLTDDVFAHSFTSALILNGGNVSMNRVRITQSGNPQASNSRDAAAVVLHDNATLTGACNSITSNYAGLSTDSTSRATSNDSDIAANNGQNGYDVYADGGPIAAQRVWWGQAGGPRPGQSQGAPVDTSDPASTQAPTADIATSSTATNPDGSYGTGALTVSITFTRHMDTGIQPTVTITGPDGQRHPIYGDWASTTLWTGRYNISPSTASGGTNHIDASGARGCVNDPTTNTMTPTRSDVTIDEPPAVNITSGPANGSYTSSRASFTFTTSDPVTGYRCSLDNKAASCTSPIEYTGLTAGTHTFSVLASNTAGAGPSQTRSWSVDNAPPVPQLTTTSTFVQLAATTTIRWAAPDASSGLANADIRYRRAAWNGTFGAFVIPSTWAGTNHTTLSISLPAGFTYCFSMRARDHVGNTSPWTAERCTSRPLDDRSLAASAGWTKSAGSAFFLGTITKTTRTGASLTRTYAAIDRIGVIATRCSTCGVIAVYVNNSLVGKVSTAGTLAYHVTFLLPRFSYRFGTVVIRTTSGKPVQIDGLDLSRV